MKKESCFVLISIFALFVSCEKSLIDFSEETYVIKVKEYGSDMLLPGVKISLYKCSKYDAVFGCQSTSLLVTHSTNNNGEYTITQSELNKADQGIILSKYQYWDINGGTGENRMEPEAWVKINLKASKAYPDTSIFELRTTGELGVASIQSFKAPKDSIVNFRLFGNEQNKVKWTLYTKDSRCYQYCLVDTLATGSLSLNPKKFETLSHSVDY